jgi:lysozyme
MRPAFPGQPTTILVDLCHYDPNANLQAAAGAGVAAVMLKATEGATFRDPAFATLLARAQDAGLLTGAYHFGTAADPAAQLDNFITAVTAAAGGFGRVAAVLDVETNTPNPAETMHPDQAEQWAAGLRARTGCTPFIYAGAYLREHGGATSRPTLASCPLWVAQYGRHPQPLDPMQAQFRELDAATSPPSVVPQSTWLRCGRNWPAHQSLSRHCRKKFLQTSSYRNQTSAAGTIVIVWDENDYSVKPIVNQVVTACTSTCSTRWRPAPACRA